MKGRPRGANQDVQPPGRPATDLTTGHGRVLVLRYSVTCRPLEFCNLAKAVPTLRAENPRARCPRTGNAVRGASGSGALSSPRAQTLAGRLAGPQRNTAYPRKAGIDTIGACSVWFWNSSVP